jgi:hypothetical protein
MYVLKILWHQNSIKSSQAYEEFIEIRLNLDRTPPSKAPALLSACPLKPVNRNSLLSSFLIYCNPC